MTDIELGLAGAREAETLAMMSRDHVEKGLGWSWTTERIRSKIRCPNNVVVVARHRDRPIGFAIMFVGLDEARLNLLAVAPEYRRRGVARRLVRWLEASMLVAGVPVIYLEVRAGYRGAQRFYERLGYRKVQRVPGYYQGRETAFRMARDLWDSAAHHFPA